ncbi:MULTISPECIES: SUF system Fe-S cluster assembly regulator [unclassified Methylophaga]|uniref:SUF system Fe-S cluster assembly regulator n=2 Tax=unclassified Methylophaga TaxID=2629249 RepID=UPI000C553AA3|nr:MULTISPECIES: SUF system Fe-S cluster assembly regulator [unclassified Methylophaga]MAX51114.1 SUF system Fe-S cluster assembly regulator [Methylophaga sp.]
MLRMGKLTDYGIVLMSHFASNLQVQHSAHAIAEAVKVPLPTVRKVLKLLSHSGLLKSERGVMGGYSLSRHPDDITVAEIITAIEGPIALTECVSTDSHCDQETHCAVQTNWTKINDAVFHALDEVKLSDMLAPQSSLAGSPIRFYSSYNGMNKTTLQDGEFHD